MVCQTERRYPASWADPSSIKPFIPSRQLSASITPMPSVSKADVANGPDGLLPVQHLSDATMITGPILEHPVEPNHSSVLAVSYPDVGGNYDSFVVPANASLQERNDVCLFQQHYPFMHNPCQCAMVTDFRQFHALYQQQETSLCGLEYQQQQQQNVPDPPLPPKQEISEKEREMNRNADMLVVILMEGIDACIGDPDYKRIIDEVFPVYNPALANDSNYLTQLVYDSVIQSLQPKSSANSAPNARNYNAVPQRRLYDRHSSVDSVGANRSGHNVLQNGAPPNATSNADTAVSPLLLQPPQNPVFMYPM